MRNELVVFVKLRQAKKFLEEDGQYSMSLIDKKDHISFRLLEKLKKL